MTRRARSDALHSAVQSFAGGERARSFADLALDIANFQRDHSPGFARLVTRRGASLTRFEEIPGVPSDTFRLARVATHPESEDVVRFTTSGTTGSGHGVHAMRRTDTYRTLALHFGRKALLTPQSRHKVVALAPRPTDPPTSSLGYMMAMFMADFEQREPEVASEPERWLIDQRGVDLEALERAGERATAQGEAFVLLATSFALVALLDALDGRPMRVHEHAVIMQTGGFKGKSREIAPNELRASIARTFGIAESRVISEYGMTELTSQLYEATLPGSALASAHHGTPGVYFEPPWLRVIPVDPISLEPVAGGDVGIARIVDLGNVDSAIAVQTQDRVRRVGDGIELLGRAVGAPPRGCSLAVEEFLAAHSS